MAYFNNTKIKSGRIPIPDIPPYVPPSPPTPEIPEDGSIPVIPTPSITGASTITLYKVADENNKLNKTLGTGVSYQGQIVEDTDILNPTLIIESTYNLADYNYAYIDTTGRYYYMHVVMLPDSRFKLIMNVDVLMSYKDAIKQCNAIISKTEDKRYINEDIDDGSFINQSGIAMKCDVYANGFIENPVDILVTVG